MGPPQNNWITAQVDSHPIHGGRWVLCTVHILKNETGEVRRYEYHEILMDGDTHPNDFGWSEGNFSCDCNREIFFERSAGNEITTEKCSDGRFSVNLENPATGEIFYREFND